MFHSVGATQILPSTRPPAGAGIYWRAWLAPVWAARFWGLGGALLGVGAAFALSQLLTPSFRATAQIFIDPQNLQLLERDLSPNAAGGDAGVVLIESQARVMGSDSVLRATAIMLDLDRDPEFVGLSNPVKTWLDSLSASDAPRDDLSRAVLALSRAVHVVRLDRTYVVNIHAQSESAGKSAAIANGVVDSYLALRESQRAEQAGRASGALDGRLGQLLGDLETAERAVEAFKTANDIIETGGQSLLEGEVGQTSQALLTANQAVSVAAIQLEQLQALEGDPTRLAAAPEIVGSSEVIRLRGELQTALADAATLSATLGNRHPKLVVAEQRVSSARAALADTIARLMDSAELALERAQENAAGLAGRFAEATGDLQNIDTRRIALRQLEREVEASRAVYENALLRSRETAEQALIDTLNAQVVSRAVAPGERSFPPKPTMLLSLGLLAGLAAGAAFGVWLRKWRA